MRSIHRLLLLVLIAAAARPLAAEDWPQWRGPDRDGHSAETGLLEEWPEGGPPLVWRVKGLGAGYSSLAIADGVIVTQGTRGRQEQVVALEARTGRILWAHLHGSAFRNDRGDGPRGTPTIDGDRLYALGGNGNLSSLKLETGEVLWSFDVLKRFGGRNISWGLSESPLVEGELLFVAPGGRGAGVVALDKETGELVWGSLEDEPSYASAVSATLGGIRQVIFFTGDRVAGLALEDGRLLWDYGRVANRTANAATPIVRGDRVFVSSDYGTGCALLEVGEERAREVYFNRNMRNHHSSSVLVGEHLYGFSSSILTALHFDSGDVVWRDRSVGKGSLITAAGLLYLLSEGGTVGLAVATPEGYVEKGRFDLPRSSSSPTWSHPALAQGHLYLRDQDTLSKYDVRGPERAEE